MEPKLREYVENLFVSAPKTKQAYELKEEIICNTIERYHDLLKEGRSEGDAYNQAIAGIGDINELIKELGGEPAQEEKQYTEEQMQTVNGRSSLFKGVAVALYICCFVPCIALEGTFLSDISGAFMFIMISVATALLIYGKKTKFVPVMTDGQEASKIRKNAVLRAVAIGMYISCVVPCIVLEPTPISDFAPIFMFLMIAAATAIIIISKNKNTYTKTDNTMVENFKEWNSKKKTTSTLYKVLVAILWVTASFMFVYITVITGFATAAVTWIIFIIAVAIQNLMRAIFDYAEAEK